MNTPQYDSLGRMRYNPDYHPNQKKTWLLSDQKYLIEHYVNEGPEKVSLALGRTVGCVMQRVCELRKAGAMPKRVKYSARHTRVRMMK